MKYLVAAGAFVMTILIFTWFFWAGGYNFDKRGGTLVLFSWLSLCFGGLVSLTLLLFWKEK